MHAIVCIRRNLAHGINAVGRYMANYGKEYRKVVQCIFRYLRISINAYLHFDRNIDGVIGYVDSSDLDKKRSLTRYVFSLGGYKKLLCKVQ